MGTRLKIKRRFIQLTLMFLSIGIPFLFFGGQKIYAADFNCSTRPCQEFNNGTDVTFVHFTIYSTGTTVCNGNVSITTDDLTIENGGILQSSAGGVPQINLTVNTNATIAGTINLNESGYAGGANGSTNGTPSGGGGGNAAASASYTANTSAGGGGGGHGGTGGTSTACTNNGAGGITYDTVSGPVYPGAGGGGATATYCATTSTAGCATAGSVSIAGGAGGGALKLNLPSSSPNGILTFSGTISANGANGGYNAAGGYTSGYVYGGGGAGGSIWIIADKITGAGTISANGGKGTTDGSVAGGGGGGIVNFNDTINSNEYTGTLTVTGGTGVASGANGSADYVLEFSSSPTGTYNAGVSFPTSTVVTVKNRYGTLVTTSKIPVTLSISNNPPLTGTLGGTTTVYATSDGTINGTATGTATFNNLYVDKVGTGYILKARAPNCVEKARPSTGFDIIPSATTSKFVITGTASQTAGATNALTITAQDAYGNTATSYTGDKSLTFSGANAVGIYNPTVTNKTGTATAFGTTTTITFTSGVATAGGSMVLYKAESASIQVTDGSVTTLTPLAVTVSHTTASKFTIAGSSTQTAGASNTLTITAKDTYGNTATSYTGDKSLTFSGANTAPAGQAPTVTNKSGTATAFGTATTITFTSGVATAGGSMVLYKAESASIQVTDGSLTTLTPLAVTVSATATIRFVITGTATQTAGATNTLTITVKDNYDNTKTTYTGDKSLTFSGANTAPGGQAPTVTNKTGTATAFGTATTITFTSGVATAGGSMVLYKAESASIQVTDGTVTTPSALAVTVKHAAADHLKFSANITTPQTVAQSFNLPTLLAVDVYDNTCDGANGATAYSGTKTVGYTLSGQANAPDDNANDSWDTTVTFTNGVSDIPTNNILYRAQNTTITANVTDDAGVVANTASNSITVNPATKYKLAFSQQPSASSSINHVISQQPKVQIKDTYGNKTLDTDTVTLYDSLLNTAYSDGPGTLTYTIATTDGEASASGLKYNKSATIYLYAMSGALQPAFSTATVYAIDQTSTVELATTPVINFDLVPTYDTLDEKFCVLKFKINDAGGDETATLIDQIKVAIGGTGVNAATDIAWAGLYEVVGESLTEITTTSTIANDYITFGSTPDDQSTAGLYTVPEGTAKEIGVYIYMKNSKLTATDAQTYTFDINEALIGTDTDVSSQMTTDTGKITPVTGTIDVDTSHLEIVEYATGNSSISVTAGQGVELKIKAVDANKNIDTHYILTHKLVFSGLNSIGGNTPKIESTVFGNKATINFTTGETGSGAVTLTAYKAETGNISVQEVDVDPLPNYTCFTLAATVSSAALNSIAVNAGNNQNGKISTTLTTPLQVIAKDQYTNLKSGTEVSFAVTSPTPPAGASVSPSSATTNSSGLASTSLTLGSDIGEYQVTASASGVSSVNFTATARTPASLNKISGDTQTKTVKLALTNPFVVKLLDSNSQAFPDETVTWTITSYPEGATGQALSSSSTVTDVNGEASTTLTLGNKSGQYGVRATYSSFTVDFTATATAGLPYKVTLSGPASVAAGAYSTAFTIYLRDSEDNLTDATTDTAFSLVSSQPTTGFFYASNSGTPSSIDSKTISAGSNSTTFYYNDSAAGTPTLTVTRTSGHTLTSPNDTASLGTNVIPGDLSYFKVTGLTSTLTAGTTRVITIEGYDAKNNLKTNLNQDINLVFSGASTSSAPASKAPTCTDKNSNAINFGTATPLTFTNGNTTTTLTAYKTESVAIKASDGSSINTSDANDLNFIVRHAAGNHLKFSGNITAQQSVGTLFSLPALNAVDLYDNLCNGDNGGSAYNTSGQVVYTLSGTANAPDGVHLDAYTSPVTFANGVSSTALSATLYRAQTTTITASVADLTGTNVASNSITVTEGAVAQLSFYQQPSSTSLTNAVWTTQPKVAVSDQYGNPCTAASDSITLTASSTTGSYTAVTNGTLSGDALTVDTVNGLATFSALKYSYPETIYLRGVSGGGRIAYSNSIICSTSSDTAFAAGALAEPATISSAAYTSETKVQVFDFKVTDSGGDGYATKIKQIKINRGASDTTGGWSNTIGGCYISDGTVSTLGVVQDDTLVFGSGASIVYNVGNSLNKTYTVSIYLKTTLTDGKVIAFEVDPNDDIAVDSIGSTFAPASKLSNTTIIDVIATNFIITASVSTITAGENFTLTLKAIDARSNIDADFAGDKSVIFSGANTSTNGNIPTCTNYSPVTVDFGDPTMITFTAGQGQSVATLYKSEIAAIKATHTKEDATEVTTSETNDLDIIVTGGAAGGLSFATQPLAKSVADAPWYPFSVNVTDAYGNVAGITSTITVSPVAVSGGPTLSAQRANTAITVAGTASFDDFGVACTSYDAPGCSCKVKASATIGGNTVESLPSNAVAIDKEYYINLSVKDSVTSSSLTAVTLKIMDANGTKIDTVTGLTQNPITKDAVFSFYLPYANYKFNFTRDVYVESTEDKSPNLSADATDGFYDNKIAWTSYLTSIAESLADYKVLSDFVYDEDADKISATLRLEKRGQQVVDTVANTLKTATLNIYSSTDAVTPIYTDSLTEPDTNGNYWFFITDAVASKGFVSGKSYFVKLTIQYGGVDLTRNVTYSASTTFDISTSATINRVAAAIAAATAAIQGQTSSIVSQVTNTLTPEIQKVTAETTKILTATGTTSLSDQISAVKTEVVEEVKPQLQSGILNRETSVKINTTVTIQYRAKAETGVIIQPVISIYNQSNQAYTNPLDGFSVISKNMTQNPLEANVWQYSVKFSTIGDYTIVCSEPTRGTTDAIVISVQRQDIDTVAGQVSSIMGQTAGVSGLKNITDTINTQFGLLESALDKISSDIGNKVTEATEAAGNLDALYNQLVNISGQIKKLGGTEGLNLENLYEVSKDKRNDLAYLKNKTQELKATMELNQKLLESQNNKPVVQSWYEFR